MSERTVNLKKNVSLHPFDVVCTVPHLTICIQTKKMSKILVIRLYFLTDALHVSDYVSPSSTATFYKLYIAFGICCCVANHKNFVHLFGLCIYCLDPYTKYSSINVLRKELTVYLLINLFILQTHHLIKIKVT